MDKKIKLKKVFDLYSNGEYLKAKEINDLILKEYPDDIYAKKYNNLIGLKLKNKSNKSTKVHGKTLKCPHCRSKIPFSGLTTEARNKIKNGDYNNLSIKCPYCHTVFVLQKRKTKSLLGLKIGDIATIGNKKYRTVGYAIYDGMWYEQSYNGKTWYIEWILLGNDNSYYYFSEGYSYDDGEKEFEFDFSNKIIPKFKFNPNYTGGYIDINGKKIYFSGTQKVKITSVYGENSKSYNIGEKVELFEFKYDGTSYVIEKEHAGSQSEAGIYKITNSSSSKAIKIFGKKGNTTYANNYNKGGIDNISKMFSGSKGDYVENILVLGFVGIVFFGNIIISFFGFILSIIFYIILLILLYFFIKSTDSKTKYILSIGIIPLLSYLIFYPLFNNILENKKEINIPINDTGSKFEHTINSPTITQEKIVKTKGYSNGGTKTYFEKITGLKFSIKSEDDKQIIKNINKQLQEDNGNNNEITELFKGKYYKLK